MPIGVKETQEIIRQAAVLSRNEPAVPARLEPNEVGMATGPRHRKRALMRAAPVPDYLDPDGIEQDGWQRLDDDIYKFLQLRKDQFGRMEAPPSHQFIAEMESHLSQSDPAYEPGTYLGLLRQAADLDQTRQTYVTASEKGTFHAFARRIGEGRKPGESFDPAMVKRYRDLLDANHPTTNRGLADLFRLVARAARMPLIGNFADAPPVCIALILEVVDIAARFNQSSAGRLEFQVGPMDVFLGARAVLFNRSVANPTLSMVKELVLDSGGLYHEDLLELLQDVGVFGSELTLLIPESLTEEGFALKGSRYSATELIVAAGARIAEMQGPVDRALATLADALVHKVQQQDGHKDRQIQSILGHFNRLLQGERRSAARLTEDRQQARFDYMSAIKKASELAKGMQTGEFRALAAAADAAVPAAPAAQAERFDAGDRALAFRSLEPAAPSLGEAVPPRLSLAPLQPGTVEAAPHDGDGTRPSRLDVPGIDRAREPSRPAAIVVGGISSREYETLLSEWDSVLVRARKALGTRSPIFKSFASQLAKVRALDTCLAYGLTPAGGRAAGRLARLLQDRDLRARLGLPDEAAEGLEDAFSMDYPGFLASVEALIAAVYGFRPVLQGVQFRLRDRMPAGAPSGAVSAGDAGAAMWADAGELDEVVLRLIMGAIRLSWELSGARAAAPAAPRFGENGKLAYPAAQAPALGECDPFLAYCALLWRAKPAGQAGAPDDPEAILMRSLRLGAEDKAAMKSKYLAWIGPNGNPSPLIPGLGDISPREGWRRGFERGYMAEIRSVFDAEGGAGLEGRLLERMGGIQADIEKACAALEEGKMRLIRERVARVLE